MKFLWLLLFPFMLFGQKELFHQEDIARFLDAQNPFIQRIVADVRRVENEITFARGALDTQVMISYDNKSYPVSKGRFFDVSVVVPTRNGIEFVGGYREATGVQEYNNIKTGEDGEFRIGVKVPVERLYTGINDRLYAIMKAEIDYENSHLISAERVRNFYFSVLADYYRLLYEKAVAELQRKMLKRARVRLEQVRQKIQTGLLPAIAQKEMQITILTRKRGVENSQKRFNRQLEKFATYLGLQREDFLLHYRLPSLSEKVPPLPDVEETVEEAYRKRFDLRSFDKRISERKIALHNIQNLKYPKTSVSLTGVEDRKYGSGYKVSVNMDYRFERKRYRGKRGAVRQQIAQLKAEQAVRKKEIRRDIESVLISLRTLKTNRRLLKEEIALSRKLVSAELKKYFTGTGSLVWVNNREMELLKRQKAYLSLCLCSIVCTI